MYKEKKRERDSIRDEAADSQRKLPTSNLTLAGLNRFRPHYTRIQQKKNERLQRERTEWQMKVETVKEKDEQKLLEGGSQSE